MIGWASRDVTPSRPVNLRGQFHARITAKVLDPVTVTALAVSSGRGGDPFIWVSCDSVAVPLKTLQSARRKLAELAPGFPAEKLIINATHTHDAPDLDGGWYPPVPAGVMTPAEYSEFFAERVAEAAAESWKGREPGFVAWAMSYAVAGHGRRALYFDDLRKRPGYSERAGTSMETNARMYGNTADPQFKAIEGYADHSVHFLFTFDKARKLTGAIVNIACPSQETESLNEISSDFWHETRNSIRKQFGKKVFLLPQCAPAGDLSPHLMFNKAAEQRMLALKGISSRQEIANRIKTAFADALVPARKDMKDSAVLLHSTRILDLPRRMVTKEEYAKVKKGFKELEDTVPSEQDYMRNAAVLFSRKVRCSRIIERYETQKKNSAHRMELHVIRLGDIAFATNTFELFSDYGIRMQARSPALQTFTVQLCAGIERPCYLPTREAEEGGSYSACVYCNEVGPEAGDLLVEETLKSLNSMWKQ